MNVHPSVPPVDADGPASGPTPAHVDPNGRRDVLVVDDNALNAKLLRLALEAQGYGVRVAYDVAAARLALTTAIPSLVLLDVQMPEVDGLTFLRELRADLGANRIPVVVISAFAAGEDLDRAYAAGADGFMPKPVNVRALLRMVAGLLADTNASRPE